MTLKPLQSAGTTCWELVPGASEGESQALRKHAGQNLSWLIRKAAPSGQEAHGRGAVAKAVFLIPGGRRGGSVML